MSGVGDLPIYAGQFVPSSATAIESATTDMVAIYSRRFNLKLDSDMTARQAKLHVLGKFLNGTIYNNLTPWFMEYSGNGDSGKYIPLQQRRPSVIYMLPKIIVNDSASMLFGEEHFPQIRCDDNDEINDFLQYITRVSNLRYAMLAAVKKGSVGSVCIMVKILEGKFYFDVMGTEGLDPVFDNMQPNKLIFLTHTKKVLGENLLSLGYQIPEDLLREYFYLIREWNENEEIYYMPIRCIKDKKDISLSDKVIDHERSTVHGLGFLPAIWAKNSPECHSIDGESTFECILDTCIELDYQLSQLGRLLKYNSDPTLVIKDPSGLSGDQLIKGSGALQLGRDGDAFLLEMKGTATASVIEYARTLREFALEAVRGNRTSPDKITAVHSGQALKMLNQSLISLVDEMRLCYGENGLLPIYQIILKFCASGKFEIDYKSQIPKVDKTSIEDIYLDWPDWFSPTPQDNLQEAQALSTLVSQTIIDRKTAISSIADKYNIMDIDEELKLVEKELTRMSNADSLNNETGKTRVDREDS